MSEFRRNLITLVSGAGLVQAIPILLAPILARLYSPEDFGLLAMMMATVSTLATLVSGRYELTIMGARNKIELSNLVTLPLLMTGIISIVLGILIMLVHAQIAQLFGKPALSQWLIWVGLPLLASGLIQTYTVYLSREKRYKRIVAGRIFQNLIAGGVSIVAALLGFNTLGLVLGYMSGLSVSAFYFTRYAAVPLRGVSLARMKTLATKHYQYPLFSAPAALLDAATQSAAVFIIGYFYHANILGYFSQANRLMAVPLVLIGASVSQTFFQHAAEQRRQHAKLTPLLLNTTKKLLLYSAPFFLLFIFIAPAAFEWAFGPGWSVAGDYGRLVAIAYWVRLGVSPISQIFFVVQRVKMGSLWQMGYFVTSISVLMIAGAAGLSINKFLLIFAAHEICLYGIYFIMALIVCAKDDQLRL